MGQVYKVGSGNGIRLMTTQLFCSVPFPVLPLAISVFRPSCIDATLEHTPKIGKVKNKNQVGLKIQVSIVKYDANCKFS